MKLTSIGKIIETYETENGFYVDVQDYKDTVNFYIYHEDYGIKQATMGIPKNSFSADVADIIQLYIENWIEEYKEGVMDCE